MNDRECIRFLQWSLPQLGMRWVGFRKVRGTVCKRVARRMRGLGLDSVEAYRARLETHPDEWPQLDAMCRIPISRFWRDRGVFDRLAYDVLPTLAATARERGERRVAVWSAGCASGEEPYSLGLAWSIAAAVPCELPLIIVATDSDATMLARAQAGLYQPSSVSDLPAELLGRAFERSDGFYRIRKAWRQRVAFRQQDIRHQMPRGPFDLILCRNIVFTYFDRPTQLALLERLCRRLQPGGALVIGAHETLPATKHPLVPWGGPEPIFRFSPS